MGRAKTYRILATAAVLVILGIMLALLRPSPIQGEVAVTYTVSYDSAAGGLGD